MGRTGAGFGLALTLWLFFFATAAVVYPSWPFFVSAWRALLKGTLGMAALIVLSVGTGYLLSVGTTFFYKEGGQFFEAVAVLLVFILLGHWLEMSARAGASSAIKALMNLTPTLPHEVEQQREGRHVELGAAGHRPCSPAGRHAVAFKSTHVATSRTPLGRLCRSVVAASTGTRRGSRTSTAAAR